MNFKKLAFMLFLLIATRLLFWIEYRFSLNEKGNPGINKLANAFGNMIGAQTAQPPTLDFGTINSDYSLTTNNFTCPIPPDGYSVCRCITYDPAVPLTETYKDGAHSQPDAGYGGAHVNKVKLPEKMYWIRPGDKVLVAWIANEAIVVDIVLKGSVVGG